MQCYAWFTIQFFLGGLEFRFRVSAFRASECKVLRLGSLGSKLA